MSYGNTTLTKLKSDFDITVIREKIIFDIVKKEPSPWLLESLERSKFKRLTTEKAKCEFMIAPILSEVEDYHKDTISLFSGEIINADMKRGLSGEIDFVFSKGIEYIRPVAPILAVVEAKKADITSGIEQCSAQLVGMDLINKKKNLQTYPLYGCVTNANDWIFIRLDHNVITIDTSSYFINELDVILGIFHSILTTTKKAT